MLQLANMILIKLTLAKVRHTLGELRTIRVRRLPSRPKAYWGGTM